MKQNKQSKLVAILTICVSIVGLTLGFAAFSNTLTISSSATVTPNKSDFKLKLYGMPRTYYNEELELFTEEAASLALYTSETSVGAIIEGDAVDTTAEIGTINNDTLTISNLKAKFTKTDRIVNYVAVLKNVGKYTAYGNVANFVQPEITCEAKEGASESLVAAACEGIHYSAMIGFSDGTKEIDWDTSNYIDEKGNIKLEIGQHAYVRIIIAYEYGSSLADGQFDVKIGDIKFDFTTAA